VRLLTAAARDLDRRYQLEDEEVSPRIELSGDWETYLSSLGKKDRHELRRKRRRLEEAGGWTIVESQPQTLADDLESFFELHSKSSHAKEDFLTEEVKTFFRHICFHLQEAGWLSLRSLHFQGQAAAAVLGFVYRGKLLLYNSGYDPAANALSPGFVMMTEEVRLAIEQGMSEVDFLRGNEKYKYDLGVPLNWSAYEDIAAFFSEDVKTIDGKPIYGHMDYGKKDPSLGWRFTDAWLSMAGAADIGIPNGLPVDEWGIRVADDKCTPVGAAVERGGATNSPAAVYALTKYVDWMKKYAPKEATGMTFGEAGPVPAQGQIAQQIFWYTAFTADMIKQGLPVVNADGTPKWRMAPGPNGPYWKQGMQNGYQDVGSWTFLKSNEPNRAAAAWLYAQFVTAKTTSLKKSIVGLTFIRDSDIRSDYFTKNAAKYGGLIEFYRSPARVAWTPTGNNVPDYPKLAQLWWKNVAVAVTGEKTPQQAMDSLANEMDDVMARLQRAGMAHCAPKLNPKGSPDKWLSDKGAPWKKLANEKPKGKTIAYDTLLNAWKAGKVR